MAWTAPRTYTTGEIVTAAILNTDVRDNLRYLKGLDGRTDFESAVAFITDETSTLTGSQNNVVLAANSVIFRWNGASTATFTGLASGVDGRLVVIVNVAASNLVLNDEDALSTAANRFALTGNLTLRPDQGVMLEYDSTSSRWRVAASGGPIDASDILSGTIATARLGTGATASNFLRGDQTYAAPATGAPDSADYLVGTAQGGLSAEIVVGATPGGELGGTWAAPTVDTIHSGSAHAVTREGGSTTEATTTSTSAVDLLTASTLTIAATEPFIFVANTRKSGGGIAVCNLKLNATVVAEAVGSDAGGTQALSHFSTTNAALSGSFFASIGPRVTSYLRSGASTYRTSDTTAHTEKSHRWMQTADMPTVEITDVIIRGIGDVNAPTVGCDELHVYSLAAS